MAVADFTGTPIAKLISLKGRVAVVTGGARGIGLAIAQRLAEAGAKIVIADKDVGGCLKSALSALKKNGAEAIALKLDTRKVAAMEQAAEKAKDEFGHLDIWVNNAGIYPSTPAEDMEQSEWQEVIDTNITGVFNGTRAALPHMKRGGVIINLASVQGYEGEEGSVHYNASKFAIRGMTAALGKELGEQKIRVVAIAPTLIETPGTLAMKKEMDKEAGGDSFKQFAKEIPLGRIGQPDDIARVALFLASDLAAFVSGTTVVVDGGSMALG